MGQELSEEYGENIRSGYGYKGKIITYKDKPIDPQFFSTSNGYTENSEDYYVNEIPYLRSVPSPWDEDSPYYLDQEVFSLEQVEEALGIDLPAEKSLLLM